MLEFRDTEGGHHRYEAWYSGDGRLDMIDIYYNDFLLGREYMGMYVNTNSNSLFWTQHTSDYSHSVAQGTFAGAMSGVIGGVAGEAGASRPVLWATPNCNREFFEYGVNSLLMLGILVGASAALANLPATGAAAAWNPQAVVGVATGVVIQTRSWYGSIRELDACVRRHQRTLR